MESHTETVDGIKVFSATPIEPAAPEVDLSIDGPTLRIGSHVFELAGDSAISRFPEHFDLSIFTTPPLKRAG